MFVKVFKILTSLALIGLLFFVVINRNFILTTKEKSQAQPEQVEQPSQESLVPPPLKQQDISSVPQQAPTSSEQISPVITATTSLKKETLEQVTKKTPTISPSGTYIALEEGHSDTDESYKPVISPCKVTMGYKLGTFDNRFGISKEKFIEEIENASSLWGKEVNKKLFTYNDKGPLTINLIYDERQERTVDINFLALEIENTKVTASELRKIYEQEKMIYQGDTEQYTKESDAFKARYEIYKQKVTDYNAKGGAPRDEYEKMTIELEALKKISNDLDDRRIALLAYMNTINQKVKKYNDLVDYANTLIIKSNSLGARKFTEGRFSPRTNTIDIYQYSDLTKLRRVVIHEIGHVLGINHNNNIQSIMYSVNSATTTTLSKEDITALKKVCP